MPGVNPKVAGALQGSKYSTEIVVGDFEFQIHYPSVEEELRISASSDSLKPLQASVSKETDVLLYAWALLDVITDKISKIDTKNTGKPAPDDAVTVKRVIMVKENPDPTSTLPRSFKGLFGSIRTALFHKNILWPTYVKASEFMSKLDMSDDELKNL